MTGLLHLVARAERGALLPAEAQQLRDGIRALLDNTPAHGAVRPTGGPERPSVADDMPDGARGAVAGAQRFEAIPPGANAEACPACDGTNLPYPFICPGHPAPASTP